MKKQMKYANDRSIPFVLLIGTNEIENKTISIKDMVTGSQQVLTIHEFINSL
jgi:histidyl-tRNA synthetase